jgi:hypothetical protein
MPFPKCKIHFNRSFGSCQRETSIEDPSTGVCTVKMVDCNTKLPDSKFFEIQNQIKAGVTLDEVNTKVINSGSINVPEFESAIETAVKKTTKKQTQKTEVTDET